MAKWNYAKIGDVCTVERGGSPRPIEKFITDDPNGINWIKIGDTTDSMYITETAQKIIPEGMKKSRYVQPGDFLLSNSMSFGRPYILKIDGCIHDGWLVLRDNDGVFDKHFLYYYLSSPSTYQKFKNMAVGGVVNNLNSDMVRGVTVPVPKMEEQIEIVQTLDNVSNLIFLRKQQLAKLDELVKSSFIELFGDPEHNTRRFPVAKLADLCCVGSSKRIYQNEQSSEGIPFLRISDLSARIDKGTQSSELYIPVEKYEELCAKKVRSKAKFWQMIGRGTRLCKGLTCTDQIDGEYTDKKRFLIFDYCGNFEYFRAHKEGFEAKETKSLTENIFGKQVKLAVMLQESAYAEDAYQAWRSELVNTCYTQVMELNTELIAVKLRMQSVEKFKKPGAFHFISEGDKGELLQQIAPIVHLDDTDEYAKRFDNFMYGLMIAAMEQMPSFQYAQKQLRDIGTLLERKVSIPQVKAKLSIIKEVNTDAFWEANDILLFETVRKELRELIKFIVEENPGKKPIITHLTDPIIDQQEGIQLDPAYDFEDYRAKVNRYVNENGNTLAIYKLAHNIPLAIGDYQELERVLTSELGSKEDYEREFGDTPFGLLVRKIAKMDHDAAMAAFSQFIDDQALNQKQIAFVYKIINHIEQNGYMESVTMLTKPPFDKPLSFTRLFDRKTQTAIMAAINQVKDNAIIIIA